jgi:hypothetical protein
VIDVVNDAEGVRMALEAIFEEDYVRSRVDHDSTGADGQTRARMLAQVPPRKLSPGYYEFGQHLLLLESHQKAGAVFAPGELAAFEVRGLVALGRARSGFEHKHPACGSCGARQQNRFGIECGSCGVKFRRKGVK